MIIEAISDLKPVNGRMELIPNKHKITIIVDYCCHTKDFSKMFLNLQIVFLEEILLLF